LLFHNTGDIIADMREKETRREPEEPTPEELEKMLSKDEAEMQEFFKTTEDPRMERIGMAEKFKTKEPEEPPREGVRPIEKKEGLGLGDYIKEWREVNPDYVLENINTNRAEITNMTDAEIPFEFVDYLIGKANDSVKTIGIHLFGEAKQISRTNDLIKSENVHLLGEIKRIKIKFDKKTKMLIVTVKDTENTIGFYFESEPPFNLKHMDSHLGIYTF